MTLRLTNIYRHALLRFGTGPCHRCFSTKENGDEPPRSLNKQFNVRSRNLLLHYINELYKGQDKRLKSYQSAMDRVLKVKNESGPLRSLDDLLGKVGLSVREAVDLCEEIARFTMKKRRSMQFSYPSLTLQDCEQVENIVAIHTSLYCISWAHLERSGRVLSWHKELIPLGKKRMHPIDCIQAVMNVSDKIPSADAYILETPDIRRAKNASEFTDGFLLSNINCSILSIISCLHFKDDLKPRMYYMNRTLVPLLFDLNVGGETVSRFITVEGLINKNIVDRREFNGITLDEWLRDLFMESNDKTKEELSIPLLAAMAAMEILVRQNPNSIEKVVTV